MIRVLGPAVLMLILLVVTWLVLSPKADVELATTSQAATDAACDPPGAEDKVSLGAFEGKVSYDEETDYFFLELRGVRLPFRTDPRRALRVPLEAPGATVKEQNTNLLYGLIGPEVQALTLLIDRREEADVQPAVEDLLRYSGVVAPHKLGGIEYVAEEQRAPSQAEGRPRPGLNDATRQKPLLLLRGPKAGAASSGVRVGGNGQFVVEGTTYEQVCAAADFVCLTIVKMLCGSADCPDAAACATGGSCGCG